MATFYLHLVASDKAGFYRIGRFEERSDRSEQDRLAELNRLTSVNGTLTHEYQKWQLLMRGSQVYPDAATAITGRIKLKTDLEAVGATFLDDNVFELSVSPTIAISNSAF